MGLLDRFFKKSPAEQMARARQLLQEGDPFRALSLAEKVAAGGAVPGDEAVALAREARRAVLEEVHQRARQAEADGFLDDALEWLRGGLDHAQGEAREGLVEEMDRLQKAIEVQLKAEEEAFAPLPAEEDPEDDDFLELDADGLYETLMGTVDGAFVDLYEGRSEGFRAAFVALNSGDPEGALPSFHALVEESPGDPILRFERGRCHLMLGHGEAAQEDLEAAWPELGEAPVDSSGELSVPSLWAEALLSQNRPWPVIDRLESSAQPEEGRPALTLHYGEALIQAEEWDRAQAFLMKAVALFPSQVSFSHQLARVLSNRGEPETAIDCLEAAVAPSCATGNCNRPAMHLPAMRLLTRLHLQQGNLPRSRELIDLTHLGLGGRRFAADYRLLAEYHGFRGEEEEAQRALSEAERLEVMEAQADSMTQVPTPGLGQSKAAL